LTAGRDGRSSPRPAARAGGLGARLETFAEGIEEQSELSLLKDEDCDSGQGFLFARPLDAGAIQEFFSSWAESPIVSASPEGSAPAD
jgi:predicted signal transduction protein with EAL and GGDEF domain